MTVCIAAMCDNGRYVISATDGKMSLPGGGVSGDLQLPKMLWLADWLVMYAGDPANADLLLEEVRHALRASPAPTREEIQPILRRAYKKRFAQWSADRNLSPYNMEMDEFKKQGRKIFGDARFAELSRIIDADAANFTEELLVVGWGAREHAAMISGLNRDGIASHGLHGMATIGCGGEVAMSTLLLLGCSRHFIYESALYAVAAAKFSAERVDGVGIDTTIYVSHKRRDTDDGHKPPGFFVEQPDIDALRTMWNDYGRPRLPDAIFPDLVKMAQRHGCQSTAGAIRAMQHLMQSASGT